MVLDLRLVKIGCRETINFFLHLHEENRERRDSSPQIYRRNKIIRQLIFFENQLKLHSPPYFEIAIRHHILPRHAGRVWLACRRTHALLILGEPAPACERASPHHAPDAPAPRPRRGCTSTQTRLRLGPRALTIIIQGFLSPLPTFQHTTEAAIRRRKGTIKKGDVSFRCHDTSPTFYPIV